MAGTTLSTTGSPGITIFPKDDLTATNWIRENPGPTAIIAGVLVLLIIAVIFYVIKRRRKALASKEVNLNESEIQTEEPSVDSNNSSNNVLPESFVIIQSPNLHTRVHQKRKSTLAVPPAFSVSHRKSVPSISQELRPPVVGWTRWSTAGLEIHTSPPAGLQPEAPLPKGYARKKRQSTPGIMMAVPVVYRRVSQAQHHAVYAPENPHPTPNLPTPKPLTP